MGYTIKVPYNPDKHKLTLKAFFCSRPDSSQHFTFVRNKADM